VGELTANAPQRATSAPRHQQLQAKVADLERQVAR